MEAFFQHKRSSRLYRFETLDFPAHLHRAVEFGYLEEGESLLSIEGKEYPLRAGDLFVIFPDRVHLFEKSRGARGFLGIARSEEFPLLQAYFSDAEPTSPVIPGEVWAKGGADRLFSLAVGDEDLEKEGVVQGYLQLLLAKLLPHLTLKTPAKGKGKTLRAVLSYLEENRREPLTRDRVARELGISESTLSHLFSSVFKISLPRYLSNLRLEEAERLLLQTELSVTAISSRSGFPSLRSFNRAFRERYGKSPTQYRKERLSSHNFSL